MLLYGSGACSIRRVRVLLDSNHEISCHRFVLCYHTLASPVTFPCVLFAHACFVYVSLPLLLPPLVFFLSAFPGQSDVGLLALQPFYTLGSCTIDENDVPNVFGLPVTLVRF